jgi:cysteinyl-tRNA synthetase
MLKIYNTKTRQKEEFKPIEEGKVSMYNCGPTVYSHQHIGNMYSSIFADTFKRILEYLEYDVKQIMNITDVGHLVSDDDNGEDKMEKGAQKAGKTVWEVAEFYTNQFLTDVKKLNVEEPFARPKATEFIQQMIELNQLLVEKGFAYETDEALYFDVTKFPKYTELSGQKLEEKNTGVRDEIYVDPKKKNTADFALWFKTVGRFASHTMHWPSPWGEGFPGWHIECSAMSKYYLGPTIDIHTGGIEHIPIHHTNEIAQSEAANGVDFVHYWVHHQLLLVDGQKMSKSLGNVYSIGDLEEKGFDPLAFRFLFLQSKYREQLNFTFESLEASQKALNNLRNFVGAIHTLPSRIDNEYQKEFEAAISDDLNTAVALSVMFRLLKDTTIDPKEKIEQILDFDKVFGLKLGEAQVIPEVDPDLAKEIEDLINQRTIAKINKDFATADSLRQKAKELGFEFIDGADGTKWKKTN